MEHEQHAALRRPVPPSPGEPSPATPLLAGEAAEGIDPSSLRFLAASALAAGRKKEEEDGKKQREEQRLETMEAARLARGLLQELDKGKRGRRRCPRHPLFLPALLALGDLDIILYVPFVFVCLVPCLGAACGLRNAWSYSSYMYMRQSSRQLWR